ncbi:hypothetical protein D3C86_1845520 [compost metagenome]
MTGHRADQQTVETQIEQAAHAQQQATGERLKGDADVVHDVVAEHHPVFTGLAFGKAAQAALVGIVHRFHLDHLLWVDHAIDQVRELVHQQPAQQQAAKKQQAGQTDEAPLRPYQSWKTGQDELQAVGTQMAAATV